MSHPEIGSLVRAKDEMWKYIEDEDYIRALRKMFTILSDIKKEDVPDELFDKVFKEEAKVRNTESNKQIKRSLRTAAPTYRKWARQIVQILWDKGYLSDKKYGVEARKDTTFKKVKPWTEE